MAKTLELRNPPIAEAVLDIDCDVPAGFDLKGLVAETRRLFGAGYPTLREQVLHEHEIRQHGDDEASWSARRGVQALQLFTEDAKQVVQVRAQGFSFNRLAPYTTLDDYLPEIARTWNLYRELVAPVKVRGVRLRYINRIPLPVKTGRIRFGNYLKLAPELSEPEGLSFRSFLNQNVAVEESTGSEVNVVLATQPAEGDALPVILDITAARTSPLEAEDWPAILSTIESLRRLKNDVFQSTLTPRCLKLFQ